MRIMEEDFNDINPDSVFGIYRVEGRTKIQILKYKGKAGYKIARALAHNLNANAKSVLAYEKPVSFVVEEEGDL